VLVLVLVLVAWVAVLRSLAPEAPDGGPPLKTKLFHSAVGLLQCFGIFIGVAVLLRCVELVRRAVTGGRGRDEA
jgi:hypothetical protein